MKSLKKYVWFFEYIGAGLLLAFSITSVFKGEFLVYVMGILFIIFGLFRVIPLIKTTESKLIKWLIFFELSLNVLVGAFMIYYATELINKQSLFGYLVGGVFYLRGFMHFLATSVKNEPTTMVGFVVNIIFITLGSIIISSGGFDVKYMAIVFLILSIISSGVLIYRGYIDHRNYRGEIVGKHIMKKAKKNKEKETNPTSDEISDIKINIDNQEVENRVNL